MRKSYRVKKEQEFQKVFHHGNSVANRQFVVYQIDKIDFVYHICYNSIEFNIESSLTW